MPALYRLAVIIGTAAALTLTGLPAFAGDCTGSCGTSTPKHRPCEWTGRYTTESARLDALLASKNTDFWGLGTPKVVTVSRVNAQGVQEDIALVVCPPRGYRPPLPVTP